MPLQKCSSETPAPIPFAERVFVRLWGATGLGIKHTAQNPARMLAHPDFAAALGKAENIIDAGGIVVLLGSRGVGKTQAICEIFRRWCLTQAEQFAKTHPRYELPPAGPRYITARDLEQKFLESIQAQRGPTEARIVRELAACPLLAIDEIGELRGTDFSARNFTQVIDKRYGSGRPTILAGNVAPGELCAIVGPSAFDRIKERGGVVLFNAWPSFRG